MGVISKIKSMSGVVSVQIEGFFTERFINLCKINNVKIWDIRNIVKGVIRFNIGIGDFKKLRKFAKKTKCKVTIKNKKGIYFTLFKYRKRKLIVFLFSLILLISIVLSTFILRIEIEGNESIQEEQILMALKESGLYVGKNKLGLNKKEITNLLRLNISDISWAGIDISGTKAKVKIVEKVRLDEKDIQRTEIGDIVAGKSGIITKIVSENGTAKFKTGSYITKGDVAIEGMIYSKFMDPQQVSAKGILKIRTDYTWENDYSFHVEEKEYTGKKLYTIGIGIDSKENMLNYLNKAKKYDINKKSMKIHLFGKEISFDRYTCLEYKQQNREYTKEELIEIAKEESDRYLEEQVLPNCIEGTLLEKNEVVTDTDTGIHVKTIYTVNEEVGKFVKTEGNES